MGKVFIIILLFTMASETKLEVGEVLFEEPKSYPSKVICLTPKFTKQALKDYILEKGILHPEIVFAQAVLETGNFKSRIFRENHNLFGMKLAKKRRTVAIGEKYGHAAYNNWRESVDDYLLWQQQWKRTPICTEYHYYNLLDRLYAEDENYVKVVKIVRSRNFEWNI